MGIPDPPNPYGYVPFDGLVPPLHHAATHQAGGIDPIPAAPVVPAVNVTLYARTTGSDTTGNGTLAKPYRTIRRALRDVPALIPVGVNYIIECSGLGTEAITDTLDIPACDGPQQYSFDFSDPLFIYTAPITIRAQPTTLQTITNPPVVTTDPITGLRSLQDVGAAWVPGAYKGKFAIGANGAACAIADNTIDTLELCYTGTLTAPIRIAEPSAEIVTSSYTALRCATRAACVLQGLRLRSTQGALSSYGLQITNVGAVIVELCDLQGFNYANTVPFSNVFRCVIRDKWYLLTGAVPNVYYSFLWNVPKVFPTGNISFGAGWIVGCIADGCTALGHGTTSNNRNFSWLVWSTRIKNGPEAGIRFVGGALCGVYNARIDNCAGAAIEARYPGALEAITVQGTGGAVGISATDGAQVRVDAGTTVAGLAGADLVVGSVPPMTWAVFNGMVPPNVLDVAGPAATAARVYR